MKSTTKAMTTAVASIILLLAIVGSCTPSVLGPIETLGELNHGDLDSEETTEKQPRDLMEFGRMMMTAIQSLLANQEKAIDARLKELELYIDNTCGIPKAHPTSNAQTVREEAEGEVSQLFQGFADYASSTAQNFIDELQHKFDAKFEDAIRKMKKQYDGTSAKSDSSSKTKVQKGKTTVPTDSALQAAISKAVQNQFKHLAAKTDLQKQTEHLEKQIKKIDVGDAANLDSRILNYTKEIHHILYSFRPIYDTFRKVVDNCKVQDNQRFQLERFEQLLQDLKIEVNENGDVLSSIFEAIEGAEDLLKETIITSMPNDTQKTQADEESRVIHTSTYKKGQMSECEDSEFLGSTLNVQVCSAAVRYDKCHLQVVAYHCCRSCTDAGLLPKVGPHRYLNLPRKVRLFKDLN